MAKVKIDLRDAKIKIERFQRDGARATAAILKEQIVETIESGRSPVKGAGGRYQRYSDSYREAIDDGRYSNDNKRKSPVNLKLTGELLSSIFAKVLSQGRIVIGFDNFLADIHNRLGAGKSKVVRRMLPTDSGETFTNSIANAVRVRLERIAKRYFR